MRGGHRAGGPRSSRSPREVRCSQPLTGEWGGGWGRAEILRFTFTRNLESKAILKDKAGRGNSIVEVSCTVESW